MEVERVQQVGLVTYWLFCKSLGESVAFEPGELMALQRFLQEHEDEITNDTLHNQVQNEMSGYTADEIKHAHELMETGITDITDLVIKKIQEEE